MECEWKPPMPFILVGGGDCFTGWGESLSQHRGILACLGSGGFAAVVSVSVATESAWSSWLFTNRCTLQSLCPRAAWSKDPNWERACRFHSRCSGKQMQMLGLEGCSNWGCSLSVSLDPHALIQGVFGTARLGSGAPHLQIGELFVLHATQWDLGELSVLRTFQIPVRSSTQEVEEVHAHWPVFCTLKKIYMNTQALKYSKMWPSGIHSSPGFYSNQVGAWLE